jgi:hypothetical protein
MQPTPTEPDRELTEDEAVRYGAEFTADLDAVRPVPESKAWPPRGVETK